MKRVLATFAGLLVLAAAIAAFAPASLVDARLASISGGTLRIAASEGTLWHGRGLLTPQDGRWRVPIEWVLDPLPLLSGATSVALRMPESAAHGLHGRVEFRESRAAADPLVARLPASIVTSMPASAALQAGGEIELRIDALTVAPTGSTGRVTAQWRNARLVGAALPVVDLGTLTAKLTVRGNALAGPVSSRGGAVQVDGDISIAANRLVADLRLVPDASAPPAVRSALSALGPSDASGAVSLRVDRSLR